MTAQATPELQIDAPPALSSIADRVRRIGSEVTAGIMRQLGWSSDSAPIMVTLASEDSSLAQRTPRWIAGFARPTEGIIVIFPARSLTYPYDSLDDVVRHELAHVVIARAAGQRDVPRWFHEGVAMIAERSWGLEDRTRAAFALTGTRWTSRELAEAFDDGGRRSAAAYAVAGAMVRDLVRQYGTDAPARILAGMRAGRSFDDAFSSATGVTVRSNEEQFWRANWWAEVVPLVTSSLVLWFVVTLLGLWAIRTRRARSAERRKEWAEEEARAEQLAVLQREMQTLDEEDESDTDSKPTIH